MSLLEFAIVTLAEHNELVYIEHIFRYLCEVQDKQSRRALWQEFQARLQPVLGENFMISIADELSQEGMQQGMQIGAMQVAKKLLANGFGVAVVAENTGLSIDTLKKLQEEIRH